MDLLQISQLKVMTRIGTYPWEQKILQELLVDIQIEKDVSQCQDNLAHTLDYEALCTQVTQFLEKNHFLLIETVAEKTAELIKTTFQLPKVTVSISKPHAIKNAKNICITITR